MSVLFQSAGQKPAQRWIVVGNQHAHAILLLRSPSRDLSAMNRFPMRKIQESQPKRELPMPRCQRGKRSQNILASVRFLFAIMPHMAITRRQKEVLDFISGFVQRNGYSPSFEEIARGLDLRSLATVHKHITNLQNKGLLARAHNRSRSLDVLPPRNKSRGVDRLPLAGRIAAGYPVEAPEIPESISLGDIIGNRDVFALQVRGESMRDDHIVDGDYVLVERTSTARAGEIVVALVRGAETTLKRYFPEGPLVRLQPANPEMNPVFVPASQVAIQGRVLGMLRKY
ncbi:MAG: transcriptional repressor LexA [Acidobacteriaceae bacterium]